MKAIEIKNLKKTYHLEKLDVPVLHGINLEIMQGEFVAIMGQSGSGKSTLLNILGLLDKPSEGSYKLAGIETLNYSNNELATLRNRYLGFIFQQFNLLPKLTLSENVSLPAIYTDSKDKEEFEDSLKLLDMVGLSERIKHRPSEVSGGQQQRAAIARSLINKPLIIFADEPTGNLDTKSAKEIIKILKDLNNTGITIVMVTHEAELADCATKIVKIQDGLIISDKKISEKSSSNPVFQKKTFKHNTFSLVKKFRDYFKEALRSLLGNKMRSILSVLGITMGVASLIAMFAIVNGAKRNITKYIENLGKPDILMVIPSLSQNDKYLKLNINDIDDLKRNVSGVRTVSGGCGREQLTIVANGKNCDTTLIGVSADYADLKNYYISAGRFFTEEENKEKKKVAVLGKTVIKKLYGDENFNPTGKYVKINKTDFQVIGVLPSKSSNEWRDEDDKVIIPLNTALYRMFGIKELGFMDVQVKEDADMSEVSESIIKRLLFIHRLPADEKDAVRVINMEEIKKTLSSVTRTFTYLFGSIAFISLLIGGIGIMNIMFVSVSERTKEIGLRKAIGANNADILFQFIIESVFVCCVGGIIGILLGSGLSVIMGKFAGWTIYITPFSIGFAFCFSGLIGLIFGVWPARKASILNPIDALRHD
ncbi:macrolide export ATP-binding/permease protein MacB [Endomicrobiia bacterium]|nr:macrolide export ATP-binding/permease protein MacB [Endomicrobiia bacterium]GHT13167.1 macrolide export ATP-binding/permease protein MacB [Endomicrobiia bacterium]GHT15422.1 macrolide export ATP-binding/permease protein MacB [Endomicrobiia bacterium]GHT20336.1 macrolide export ATP-binding/permease protein MacB [Endomicrobiia bacterium]GHT27369.1 macrolide export ATP-binding/permease protein MacB [Endomicrobiia bacterium]